MNVLLLDFSTDLVVVRIFSHSAVGAAAGRLCPSYRKLPKITNQADGPENFWMTVVWVASCCGQKKHRIRPDGNSARMMKYMGQDSERCRMKLVDRPPKDRFHASS